MKNITFRQKSEVIYCCFIILFFVGFGSKVYGQSASFGSTFIGSGTEVAIFGEHSFSDNSNGTLGRGIIATDRTSVSSLYSWADGSSWKSASDAAFVDGYVRKYGGGSFIFPIGDNNKYRPARIAGMINANDITTAAYYLADPSTRITSNIRGGDHTALPAGGVYSLSSKGADVVSVSAVEYWDIDGTVPVNITLTYDNNSSIAGLVGNNVNTLSIVGWNGSQWVKIPSTLDATSILGGTSNLTAGSITTNAKVTPNTYSVYTLAGATTNSVSIAINLKVLLQGALLGITDGIMRSSLVQYANNANNPFPLSQPYTATLGSKFTPVSGGTEMTTANIINANSGTNNAIVDWVFIEFRDATTPTEVVKTISALVQRDGDIVDAATGGGIVTNGLPERFYVSIKHRNHLGVMTATPFDISISTTVTFDFTTATSSDLYHRTGYDGYEMATDASGKKCLWAGNANADTRTKYDGALNDRLKISSDVIDFPTNTSKSYIFNNALGYFMGDINMDGRVKYDGLNNDRILIQEIILSYSLNPSGLSNYNNMIEQLP